MTGSYYFHTNDGYLKIDGRPYYYGSEQETWSVFVDDSWALSDRLTLNLGLRFDQVNSDIPDYPKLDRFWNETGETIPGENDIISWTKLNHTCFITKTERNNTRNLRIRRCR